jgi:nitrite reductase/ring-hydroxylating ferredoxin subunit
MQPCSLDIALAEVRKQLMPYEADISVLPHSTTDTLAIRWQNLDENPNLRDIEILKLVQQAEKILYDTCPDVQQIWHYPQPLPEAITGQWYPALNLLEIPYGRVTFLDVKTQTQQYDLLFSRLGVKVTCFDNVCSHLNMSLTMGKVQRGTITCPFHGYQFCLETGSCFNARGTLKSHPVRVGRQQVEIFLPSSIS